MSNEQKENNPFEPPQTNSKSQIEPETLRGDYLGALAHQISRKVMILFVIGLFLALILTPVVAAIGVFILAIWVIGEVIAFLVAIASFFFPASSRTDALKALLLSGFALAIVIGLFCFEMVLVE